MHTRLFES